MTLSDLNLSYYKKLQLSCCIYLFTRWLCKLWLHDFVASSAFLVERRLAGRDSSGFSAAPRCAILASKRPRNRPMESTHVTQAGWTNQLAGDGAAQDAQQFVWPGCWNQWQSVESRCGLFTIGKRSRRLSVRREVCVHPVCKSFQMSVFFLIVFVCPHFSVRISVFVLRVGLW